MTVAMLMDNPAGSEKLYHALRAELHFDGPLAGRCTSPARAPTAGWRVIELFESAEAASRFLTERFAPALAALGNSGDPPQPHWSVHTGLTANRVVTGA